MDFIINNLLFTKKILNLDISRFLFISCIFIKESIKLDTFIAKYQIFIKKLLNLYSSGSLFLLTIMYLSILAVNNLSILLNIYYSNTKIDNLTNIFLKC